MNTSQTTTRDPKTKRIYKDRYYVVVQDHRHCATGEYYTETSVMAGTRHHTGFNRWHVAREWSPVNGEDSVWRLHDGHLPDCQPRALGHELIEKMQSLGITTATLCP